MKLPGFLRATYRFLLSFLFSLSMYLIAVLIRLVCSVRKGSFYRPLTKATSIWGYGIALIWGMRIRVSGPRPRDPFFLISNHMSYVDIVLLCAVSPAWFVSKSEVATWPGIGALTRMGLTIFIDRETRRDVSRMNRLIAGLIDQGGSVVFFPEGTTSDGNAVQPFKPSLFQPAVDLNMPVHVAAITYTTPEDSPPSESLVAWYGEDEFLPHIKTLLAAPGFTAYVRFADQPIAADNRKELSARTREELITLHRELRKEVS